MRPAVFLDRDGVLNPLVFVAGRAVAPRTLGDFSLFPGAARAVQTLRRAGLVVIVVTNQPEIARGRLSQADLELMHLRLRSLLPVHAVYTCPHDDSDLCHCRKPLPGLLFRAAGEWSLALHGSFMVGDSWRDMAAGRAAGCRTMLLSSAPTEVGCLGEDDRFRDLQAAAAAIVARQRRSVVPSPTCSHRVSSPIRG